MDTFTLWANSFPPNAIFTLDGDGDTGLYKTQKQNFTLMQSPVYHVWNHGKWVVATLNYHEANSVWSGIKERA